MPRDNDKHNAPPRGRRDGPSGGKQANKGRSGVARGPDKAFAKRSPDGKFEGGKRPYAPRGAEPGDSPKSYGKKPYSGPGKPYAGKRDGAAPARSFGDHPKRDFGERPKRDFSERSARGADRPDRAPRPDFRPREGGDKRSYSPRPAGDGGPRSNRPNFIKRDNRAPRGERSDARSDSRPAGRFGDKKFGDKKFGDKRPYASRGGEHPRSDRPQGDRPFKPRGDRPGFDRDGRAPPRDVGGRDRSDSKPWEKRDAASAEHRGRNAREDRSKFSRGDRPARSFDKPRGSDDRPRFSRPRGDRPERVRSAWQEHPRSERRGDERPRREGEDDAKIFSKRPAFGGRGEYRERKPDERRLPRPPTPKKPGERIAKLVARAGLCSRRDAEEWITQGRVAVNGRVINSPALDITSRDAVTIDGKPLPAPERTRLFMFHKPRGLMTTHADPEGRPTVFDHLPEGLPRLISIGRLDFNTEGLLLLTNDGGLARTLELPDTGWLRRYRVRAHGEVTQAQLNELRDGVEVDGVKYGSIDAQVERDQGANVWLLFAIREGKNREVRNVLAHLGLEVNRLIRVSYGPFQLGELEEGQVDEVKTRVLREQLGEKIAAASGADFARQIASKGDISDDPPVPRKPGKRSTVEDRKGRRVLVERSGGDDVRARKEDAARGFGPPKRPKRAYHGKRDLAPKE